MRRFDRSSVFAVILPAAAMKWWISQQAVVLVPPVSCAGALEMIGAAAMRTWPDALFAPALYVMHVAAAITAVAVLAFTIRKQTGSPQAAAGVGVMCAAAWMWTPPLAISDALPFAVAALVWSGLLRSDRSSDVSAWTLAGLVSIAAMVPPLSLAVVAAVAVACWPRAPREARALIRAGMWIIAVIALPLLAVSATPSLPGLQGARSALSCIAPVTAAPMPSLWSLTALCGISVIAIALAALGLVARGTDLTRRQLSVIAPLWLLSAALLWISPSLRTASVAAMGLWMCIGWGLAEVVAQASRARWSRLAAAVATLSIVALTIAPRLPGAQPGPARPHPLGHDALTPIAARTAIARLPPNAAIVGEDAMTDLILRAWAGRISRSGLNVRQVAPTVDAVLDARASTRVFAWPIAQTALQQQGLRLDTAEASARSGLAEITGGGRCVTATSSWQPATSLIGAPAFTLVAPDGASRGPVVMWLDGGADIDATRREWPASALRGFQRVVFQFPGDRQNAVDRRSLDGAPAVSAAAPSTTRVELWRTPEAPLSLSVALSAPPAAAFIRLSPDATSAVKICPSFSAAILPIPAAR